MSDDDEQRFPFSRHKKDDTPAGDSPEHSDAQEGAPLDDEDD